MMTPTTSNNLVGIQPTPPPSNPNNWVRFRSIAYLCGRGIAFGASGILPPQAMDLGKYAVNADIIRHTSIDVCDLDFGMFAEGSCNFVFIGRRLEEVPEPQNTLKGLASKIKVGGHLVIHTCDGTGETDVLNLETLNQWVGKCGAWVCKARYVKDGQFLGIYKRAKGSKGIVDRKVPTKPQACIARYGALGDMVMITPLIKKLYEDGFDVTLNITPYASSILEHNPYVANVVLQERDAIPNQDLGPYWAEWESSYDKYINLSESIEGALLKVEGRKEFFTSKAFRHATCNKNYYDYTMARAGYPDETGHKGELFFTKAEERDVKAFFDVLKDRFVILWALKGSSHHKVYPLMEPVMRDYLARNPNAVLVTMGDSSNKPLEFQHPQVENTAGEWSIRQSFLATKYASVVIGPESALVNAASCFDTPKIVLLSHSSPENLTKYWTNTTVLEPSQDMAPCYPCHGLHYSLESCPLGSIMLDDKEVFRGPVCAMGAISGDRVIEAIDAIKDKTRI